MKQAIVLAVFSLVIFSCKQKAESAKDEQNSEEMTEAMMESPDQEEWTVLFDGSSFDNWKGYLKDEVPETWKIEDGAMVFYPPKPEDRKRADGKGYDSYNIVTKKAYTNFVLSLEWRVAEAGNSGIFWGIKEDAKYGQPYETGPEIQVLDNEKHPDAKNGTTHQAGSLYDMVAPSKDVTKPVGEWNTCVITVNHETNQGEVVLNGEKIVSFPVANEEWNAMVAKSKFADWEGFGKYTTGLIGLQDHGDIVAYRNIKIKEL